MTLPQRSLFHRFVVLLIPAALAFSQSYNAITVAGTSRLMDGSPANTVPLRAPAGVAQDAAGNVYIADRFDHRIRKVGVDGKISTVAGTGVSGYSGDSGIATKAQINAPRGLRLDGKGNLFICDYGNSRIRKLVLSSGIITTVAGSGKAKAFGDNADATQAGLDPFDVAVDSTGNLYVADFLNSRIRKVDSTTGKITTIAGNGLPGYAGDNGPANVASLNAPNSVIVDQQGAVYFTDFVNNVVRKVDQKSGMITAFAGTGDLGFGNPRLDGDNALASKAFLYIPFSLALESTGNIVLITYLEFWRITVADGKIHVINVDTDTGFAGDGGTLTNAVFGLVTYAAGADNGDLLLSDQGDFRVRRVHGDIINTVAGTAILDNIPATQAFLNSPASMAPDGKGGLLIADSGNNRVRSVTSTGSIANVLGTGVYGSTRGRLASPTEAIVDAQGNVFVSDTGNNRILRYVPGGNTFPFAGGNNAGSDGDNAIAVRAQLNSPHGLAFDTAGNLYVSDTLNFKIRKIDAETIITTFAGTGEAGFGGDNGPANKAKVIPGGITFNNGSLYIADTANNRIRKIDLSTNIITTVVGIGTPGYTGDGGPAVAAQLRLPTGVAFDAAGTMYIADEGNSVVRRVKGGTITTIAGNGALVFNVENGPALGVAMDPVNVVVDKDGSIYVADQFNDRIRKLVVVVPAAIKLQSGDGQSGPPGTLVSLGALVTDANGGPVGGVDVTFSVASGTATIAKPTVQTGGNGVATGLITLGSGVGPVKVTASAAGVGSITFSVTITAPPPPPPTIGTGGVEGAGLSQPPVVALSTGGIGSIFGTNFFGTNPGGGATFQKVGPGDLQNGKVPTNFKNICVDAGGTRAPIFGVSDTQINFQTPAIASSGTIAVRVITGCGTDKELASAAVNVAAQAASPEFFYFAHNADGKNPVAATDSVTFAGIAPADLFPGSGFAPAAPRQYVTVYFTGGGVTNPAVAPGDFPSGAAQVAGELHVFLNGKELPALNILYCGLTPQNPGLYQLNLLLPDDTAEGNLTLTLSIAGVPSPAGAFLAVAKRAP